MKRLLVTPIALSFFLVGCGLSQKEMKAYESEIGLFERLLADTRYIDELNERIQRYRVQRSNSRSRDELESITNKLENTRERNYKAANRRAKYIQYISCLKRYKEIKEPFAKARTFCILETGIDRRFQR